MCFGELSSWFFCYKLRHKKGGRECVFCSFAAAVEGQARARERGRKRKTSLHARHERTEREAFFLLQFRWLGLLWVSFIQRFKMEEEKKGERQGGCIFREALDGCDQSWIKPSMCNTSIITRLDQRWLLSLRWEVNKDEKDQQHVAEEKAGSGRKAHNDYLYIFTPIFKVHARLTALKETTAVHSRNLVF